MNTYTKGKKLIGKGAFSKCFDNGDKTVTIISNCPCKEAMSLGWWSDSSRFPKVERLEYLGNGSAVYKMEKFEKVTSLKESLTAKEYALYQSLRDLHNVFVSKCVNLKNKYDRLDVFRDCVKASKLHHTTKTTLIEAAEGLSNYTTAIGFEISPRNVAVKRGKLVFLDLFYDVTLLNKLHTKKG